MHVSGGCLPKFKRGSIGPYLYVERGDALFHVGVRYFRSSWQHGLGAWFTLRFGGRYRIFWRRGA